MDGCCCLQKHAKYVESGLKAVKARNEYILCLEAANAAVQKYFSDDIHDLINVCITYTTFLALSLYIKRGKVSVLTYVCTYVRNGGHGLLNSE